MEECSVIKSFVEQNQRKAQRQPLHPKQQTKDTEKFLPNITENWALPNHVNRKFSRVPKNLQQIYGMRQMRHCGHGPKKLANV